VRIERVGAILIPRSGLIVGKANVVNRTVGNDPERCGC
jgi:hypothetical protein